MFEYRIAFRKHATTSNQPTDTSVKATDYNISDGFITFTTHGFKVASFSSEDVLSVVRDEKS